MFFVWFRLFRGIAFRSLVLVVIPMPNAHQRAKSVEKKAVSVVRVAAQRPSATTRFNACRALAGMRPLARRAAKTAVVASAVRYVACVGCIVALVPTQSTIEMRRLSGVQRAVEMCAQTQRLRGLLVSAQQHVRCRFGVQHCATVCETATFGLYSWNRYNCESRVFFR